MSLRTCLYLSMLYHVHFCPAEAAGQKFFCFFFVLRVLWVLIAKLHIPGYLSTKLIHYFTLTGYYFCASDILFPCNGILVGEASIVLVHPFCCWGFYEGIVALNFHSVVSHLHLEWIWVKWSTAATLINVLALFSLSSSQILSTILSHDTQILSPIDLLFLILHITKFVNYL